MLPERLCNFICSLRPDEEKLAYSVIFEVNEKAEVKNYRIRHTVIKSNRRFTYEEAQQIIETGEGDYKEEVLQLNRLAQILREKRMAAGSINFDRCEVKFEIDETGKPLSVYFKVSKEANKLIEEFMLLANKTVAEYVGKVPKNKKPKVLPYRIHDLPDPDKLDNLNQFIARFGYKIRTGGSKAEVSKSINHLLGEIEGKKEQNLIETVSLRAMQKARYSIYNIGHYGLAFDYYTHFTSPIRRYPDLMVHRLLIAAEVLIRPGKMLNVIELAGGAGAGLRMEPVGVRLVVNSAILAGNGILIAGIDGQVRKESLPEFALLGKWINGQVPAVKISDHGNSLCMRRPNVEPPAVDVSLCGRVCAEEPPAVRQAAAVIQLSLICHGSPLSAAILFFLILRVAF